MDKSAKLCIIAVFENPTWFYQCYRQMASFEFIAFHGVHIDPSRMKCSKIHQTLSLCWYF